MAGTGWPLAIIGRRSPLRVRLRKLYKNRIARIAAVIVFVWVAGGLLTYLLERGMQDGPQAVKFRSAWDGVWWGLVTIATVGYGDMFPVTVSGRLLAMLLILLSMVSVSILTATVASAFVERSLKEAKGLKRVDGKGHVLICGWNKSVGEILYSLSRLAPGELTVVLVNQEETSTLEALESRFPQLEIQFVRGDHTNTAALRQASPEKARAGVLLAEDRYAEDSERADQQTVIAAHALAQIAPNLPLTVQLRDAKNQEHLKRVRIQDIVVASHYVGLIAANSSVSPGVADLLEKILSGEEGKRVQRVPIPKDFVGKTFGDLAKHFVDQETVLLGLVRERKLVGLEELLSDDPASIDGFIKQKFFEAGKAHLLEESLAEVQITPPCATVISPDEVALVIR